MPYEDIGDSVSNATFVDRVRNAVGDFIESSAGSFDDEFLVIDIDHRILGRSEATSGSETGQVPSGSTRTQTPLYFPDQRTHGCLLHRAVQMLLETGRKANESFCDARWGPS